MSAIEPAGEKVVRNLQQAIERLQHDIARVELWAGALGCFTKPIPDYGHGQTRFDLPMHSKWPEAPLNELRSKRLNGTSPDRQMGAPG